MFIKLGSSIIANELSWWEGWKWESDACVRAESIWDMSVPFVHYHLKPKVFGIIIIYRMIKYFYISRRLETEIMHESHIIECFQTTYA
jgi:hypothetical protein